MQDGRHFDEHKGSCAHDFASFEQNRMVHSTYRESISRRIEALGCKSR